MNKNIILSCLVILSLSQIVSGNPAPIPDYDFDKNFENLANSNLSLGNLTAVGASPYEDILDNLFWGLLFVTIFVMLWITTEDITIPAMLGMLIGASIWTLLPGDWVVVGQSLTAVSFCGLMYSIIKKG